MDVQELSPREVAALLRAMLRTLEAELTALPSHVSAWRPRADEWCVHDVLGHLIESEKRGFAGRIRTLLTTADPYLPGWNQEEVARARDDGRRPLAALLQEFGDERRASIALVQGLSAADLDRAGTHQHVGQMSVRDLLHEWVHHDRNHVRQIFANVQAYAWPHMRNCQLFTTAHAL